jgi:hypothetical protein
MKNFSVFLFLFIGIFVQAQEKSEAQKFWENLKSHCGKAYEGQLIKPADDETFGGKKLVIYLRACEDGRITIPFYVGEDKSRTFILTYEEERIQLKHDHRHRDGSEDEITQYGGKNTNAGLENIQFFPADAETARIIPAASTNVWWITIGENTLTYNLQRMGTERPPFKVSFDLTNPIDPPGPQWGWE